MRIARVARLPIIQYWHSAEVPDYIAALIATFRERNPSMRHLVFSERTADSFIAERHGERHVRAFRACAVPAMQADYLRYCAVYTYGGIYADVDFGCIRTLHPLLDLEGHLFQEPAEGPALNGLFAFRSPGHPLLAMAIEIATRNIEARISESITLTTGPGIFTGLAQLHRNSSLEALRDSVGPNWKPRVEACWEPLADSFTKAIDKHGPLAKAFEGVRISTRTEMLTWVERNGTELPYKQSGLHWVNWQERGETIFR